MCLGFGYSSHKICSLEWFLLVFLFEDELEDKHKASMGVNLHSSFAGHEHDEHGIHDGAAGMPIHSHFSQKDPQKVIKDVKKAIEDGEGCQVIKISMTF